MTVNETALSLDDTIRAEGQPLGRFTLVTPDDYDVADNGWDWYPDPDGTHDGYLWLTGFYCLNRRHAGLVSRAAGPLPEQRAAAPTEQAG